MSAGATSPHPVAELDLELAQNAPATEFPATKRSVALPDDNDDPARSVSTILRGSREPFDHLDRLDVVPVDGPEHGVTVAAIDSLPVHEDERCIAQAADPQHRQHGSIRRDLGRSFGRERRCRRGARNYGEKHGPGDGSQSRNWALPSYTVDQHGQPPFEESGWLNEGRDGHGELLAARAEVEQKLGWVDGLGPKGPTNPKIKGFVLGRYARKKIDPQTLERPAGFESTSMTDPEGKSSESLENREGPEVKGFQRF